MPIYFNKRSQWSVLVHSPKIYPVSCFDAYLFSVEARFSLETLYQLPPFLEKVIRAWTHKCCLENIYARTARMDFLDAISLGKTRLN